MKTHKITMALECETAGAVRYEEINEAGVPLDMREAVIGRLYMRKHAIGVVIPREITVTVEAK